jgi:hypothetical protein
MGGMNPDQAGPKGDDREKSTVEFRITVYCTDQGPEAVRIESDPPNVTFEAMCEATSHMMAMTAKRGAEPSVPGCGQDDILNGLCEDARANMTL